jgi:hypothetical protein
MECALKVEARPNLTTPHLSDGGEGDPIRFCYRDITGALARDA